MLDPFDRDEAARHEHDELLGQLDDEQQRLDRLADHGPHPTSTAAGAFPAGARLDLPASRALRPVAVDTAYVEAPSERERREHRLARADETAAVARLYPRPRLVQAAPQNCPVNASRPRDEGPEAA